MDKTLKRCILNVVLPLALVLTFLTIGAQAVPQIPPILIPQDTTYQEGSGGIASDTCPNAILHVAVITVGDSPISSVVVNVSQVNTTGYLSMVRDGSIIIGERTAMVYSAGVYVDKPIRPGGVKYLPVVATDSTGNTGSTELVIVAFNTMGVTVIGYNPSKAIPSIQSNVSFFYDHNPVKIIVTSIDGTHYTNVTATFSAIDGSTSVEYDNSGVLLPDGNYVYEITHTLGTIPGMFNVNMSWINVTFNVVTPVGTQTIYVPQIGAFVVLGNFNPKDDPSYGLGGDTTDWRTIPDYSAAYLVFEPVDSVAGKIATLKFNEPIDLTDYETAMQLKNLGEMLTISKKSMDLNASANALSAFNKASNLTIYNLTEFTVDPGILENGLLVPLSGGVITNYNWNNSTKTLSFSVGHWTAYSWDGTLPSLYPLAVDYPTGQTAVKSGQSVQLNAEVYDLYSGVLNVTADATIIGGGLITFSNTADNVWSKTTLVNAADGNYTLTVVAYDKAANRNTGIITVSVNNNATPSEIPVASFTGTPTSGNAPLTVRFTDSSTNTPTSWLWNFGDSSSVNATQRNPVHTYASAGTYTVALTATNSAGSNTFTRTNYITVTSPVTTSAVGVFRSGTFYRNGATPVAYGLASDRPVTGNWNGGTTTGVGVYRSGTFYLNGYDGLPIAYGLASDTPVTGDWNGDGHTEVGVFRSGTFYQNVNGVTTSVPYGLGTDVPVTGDWNGDGTTEVGVFRSGTFYQNVNGVTTSVPYGLGTDVPVTGDWNGDGTTEVGVFRSGTFYQNVNGVTTSVPYGLVTDTPVTGKWT